MNPIRSQALSLLLLLLILPATADVFKPAYLQLKQTSTEEFDVMWKVPAMDSATTLKVVPVFPEGTGPSQLPTGRAVSASAKSLPNSRANRSE